MKKFDIEEELTYIRQITQDFEQRLYASVRGHIDSVLTEHPNMSVVINKKTDTVLIVVSHEKSEVAYCVNFTEESTIIEVIIDGGVVGLLNDEDEAYNNIMSIVEPIENAYRSMFSWDGKDFIKTVFGEQE
jgi:hypothetical protein